MYKRIAAGRARKVFADLAAGDDAGVMKDMADDVHHIFPGDPHPPRARRASPGLPRHRPCDGEL
jgi:hypothetical protein